MPPLRVPWLWPALAFILAAGLGYLTRMWAWPWGLVLPLAVYLLVWLVANWLAVLTEKLTESPRKGDTPS